MRDAGRKAVLARVFSIAIIVHSAAQISGWTS